MNLGEKLLDLAVEYQQAKSTAVYASAYGTEPAGRTPAEIGAEYEVTLRQVLAHS